MKTKIALLFVLAFGSEIAHADLGNGTVGRRRRQAIADAPD